MEYDIVCPYPRMVQYRLLRIEWELFLTTSASLRYWVTEQMKSADDQYYVVLGKLATANHRSLIRLNEIRARLSLPPYIDTETYPVVTPE